MPPRRGRPAGSAKGPAAAKGKSASTKAAKQPPASSQRRSARGQATLAEEEQKEHEEEGDEEAAEAEEEEDDEGEGEKQRDEDGQMNGDKATDEAEDAEKESSPARRSARHSTSSDAPKGKAAAANQRGASAQEHELLALVDAISTWKGSSSVTKEAMGKTLKQASALLADYRSTERSATPSSADIPAADRPLLKTIAKAMVQRSVLQNKAEEVRINHTLTSFARIPTLDR